MKNTTVFNAMSMVREDLITESLTFFEVTYAGDIPKRPSVFSRFINSGWGVAMICAFVSLSVLSAIIWAGNNPPDLPPASSEAWYETSENETATDAETVANSETETTKNNSPFDPDIFFNGGIVDQNPPQDPRPSPPTVPDPSPELPGFNIDYDLPNTPPGPTVP